MSERVIVGTSERDQLSEIIFISLGSTADIGAHSIFEEVAGFSLIYCDYCCACYSLK